MVGARKLGLGALALGWLVLAAGCQRSTVLNPVNGKVTYKGALLNNGFIVFTPDASRGESGPMALGTIGADGSYTLSTDDGPGAGAGWYRVTVTARIGAAQNASQRPVSLLPEKYRDPELSLLRCQVKPNQVNVIDLNLD
jgi:hypothetical protein